MVRVKSDEKVKNRLKWWSEIYFKKNIGDDFRWTSEKAQEEKGF
jgi:hypothetical protein